MFRELRSLGAGGPGDVRATHDTAPRLPCFDDRVDVALPPAAFMIRADLPDERRARARSPRARNRTRATSRSTRSAASARRTTGCGGSSRRATRRAPAGRRATPSSPSRGSRP